MMMCCVDAQKASAGVVAAVLLLAGCGDPELTDAVQRAPLGATVLRPKGTPPPPFCGKERVTAAKALAQALKQKPSKTRIRRGPWGTVELIKGTLPLFGKALAGKGLAENAKAALSRLKPLLGLTAHDRLSLRGVEESKLGRQAVFDQLHDGIPAGYLVLELDAQGAVIGLRNHTIPDIVERGFASKATSAAAQTSAESALRLNHPEASKVSAKLRFRATNDRCSPGELTMELRYSVNGQGRKRVVDARSGMVLSDRTSALYVDSRLRREHCQSGSLTVRKDCSTSCAFQTHDDVLEVCETVRALSSFWAIPRDGYLPVQYVKRATRLSYDAHDTCMRVDRICGSNAWWDWSQVAFVSDEYFT